MSERQIWIVDRSLHWLSAGLILLMLLNMGSLIHLTDYTVKGDVLHKQDAIESHFIEGSLLLLVMLLRGVWCFGVLPDSLKTQYHSVKHKWVVRAVHSSMSLLVFGFIFSGLVMVTNYAHMIDIIGLIQFSPSEANDLLFTQARDVHLLVESILYWMILLHLAGAIYKYR